MFPKFEVEGLFYSVFLTTAARAIVSDFEFIYCHSLTMIV